MKNRFSLMACAIVACALFSCADDDAVQDSYDYGVQERLAMYEEYYAVTEKLIEEMQDCMEWHDIPYYDTVGSGSTAIEYTNVKNRINGK